MKNFHDYQIISYNVDLQNRKIQLITTFNNSKMNDKSKIVFLDVLAHYFVDEISYSIIFDIEECDIDSFMKENYDLLIHRKKRCWPMKYNTSDELVSYIINNGYRYYVITSSSGLNGWVMAKNVDVFGNDEIVE